MFVKDMTNFVTKLNANRSPLSDHVRHVKKVVWVYELALVATECITATEKSTNLIAAELKLR